MNTKTITGSALKDMIVSAANVLNAHKQEVNELNVFPVPDGDTGTNMSMTMNSAVRELSKMDESVTVSAVSETTASSLLRGARGNSGVILSLLFRGIARYLKGKAEATGTDLAYALQSGVEAAYKAVMKPAEGTILTVAREAAEAAKNAIDTTDEAGGVLETIVTTAQKSLARTPELLPVLKKAGVVDAGGKGLVMVLGAMLDTLRTGNVAQSGETAPEGETAEPHDNAAGKAEEDIRFTYCTEFIINKDADSHKDPLALRAYLESMGDCVLVADDTDFIKVHFHTNAPGTAIQEALTYGYLTHIKIDNMRVQHEEKASQSRHPAPVKPVGFVAVAAGNGIADLFRDLGVDRVVEGGQTMNPSTEDILDAVEAVSAETVIVLPNNKNIILAAEQAVSLADCHMHVLHTKTIPQGISAMLVYNPDEKLDANLLNMEGAFQKVQTGQVTFAARDSEFDGHKIQKDAILAMREGRIVFQDDDPVKAAVRLIGDMADKSASYITVIYGEGITAEQAAAVRDEAGGKLPAQAEINVISGGQPVYHFIISVE